jgi:ankyrin repeat protein
VKKRIVVAGVLAVLLTLISACSRFLSNALISDAAFNHNPAVITTLLKAGADIKAQNKAGNTALMFAASNNQNPEVITTLLKAGADINTQNKYGTTSLMFAVSYNPTVIATLLQAGADTKIKDNEGKTANDYAKHNDSLKGTDALKQLEEASK